MPLSKNMQMVGYVFLVSSALEPLSCTQDVDKKWYMAAHAQTECNWCNLRTKWYYASDCIDGTMAPCAEGVHDGVHDGGWIAGCMQTPCWNPVDPDAPNQPNPDHGRFILFSQSDLPCKRHANPHAHPVLDSGLRLRSEFVGLLDPVLAIASYFIASIYAIGVPIRFFTIMYSANSANLLRSKRWNNNYGFLTSKTSERYYW